MPRYLNRWKAFPGAIVAAAVFAYPVCPSIISMALAQTPRDARSANASAVVPTATAKLPQWDVVSVKQADPGTCVNGTGSWLRPDGLTFHCVPLLFVVESSFQVMERSRILGIPDWLKNGGLWNIDAKVSGADAAAFGKLTRAERDLMVRTLLEERFHMKAHVERREMPVYELVVAKGGPKLKASTPEEDGKARINMGRGGAGRIEAIAATMDALPWMLGDEVGRPVANKTGLTGKYDFTLEYVPSAQAATDETGGPSIFTAIEEQLGLKLEPAKEPMDVLVIDSIEQPAAN